MTARPLGRIRKRAAFDRMVTREAELSAGARAADPLAAELAAAVRQYRQKLESELNPRPARSGPESLNLFD